MLRRFALIWGFLWPVAAPACDVALVLAVDVSGSIDPLEFKVQQTGLAAALRDGAVVDALVTGEAAVAMLQWTGEGRQALSVPWMRVRSGAEAEQLARAVEVAPRRWDMYSTAIGDAMVASRQLFRDAPDCRRRIVDISSDGISNEGGAPSGARAILAGAGITVNALVIETDEIDLTAYFRKNVITGAGAFVVTANGFEDYPGRIRQKLIRELAVQVSGLGP